MSKKNEKSVGELLKATLVPKEEQPYTMPENWVWVKLGSISKVISKGTTPPKDKGQAYSETGVNFIRVENITKDMRLDLTNVKYVDYETHSSILKRSMGQENDVLISIAGALGRVALIGKEHIPCNMNQAVAFVRLHSSINPKYVMLALASPFLNGELVKKQKTTAQANLTLQQINEIDLPLPPLNEQKRIADKVERLLGKINQAKQLIEEAQETFELRRAAILDKAFRGELTKEWRDESQRKGSAETLLQKIEVLRKQSKHKNKKTSNVNESELFELPDGWKWIILEELIELSSYGTSAKTNDDINGVPVLRMGNIFDGLLTLENLKYLPTDHIDVEKNKLEEYDLLFNRTNSYELVGKTAVVRGEQASAMSYASYLVNVRLYFKDKLANYICYYINSHMGRNYLLSMVTQQVGQANINASKLASLLIPLPPEEEIKVITQKIDRLLECERSIMNCLKMKEQFDHLTESVLSKAFRGELDTNIESEENCFVGVE